MVSVGIRELKNNLSRYLRMVQAGERVLITDRGRPVAELGMPGLSVYPEDPYMATYNRLIREGAIRRGRGGDPFARIPAGGIAHLPAGTWEEWLEWSREDKWP